MNQIANEISGHTLANQVRMEGAAVTGAFLLVEGASDYRVFSRWINSESCSIVICQGRENLLAAISILEESGFRRSIGFADKDYGDILGFPPYSGSVIFTDETDLDTQIMRSPALDAVLLEFGSDQKVSQEKLRTGGLIADLIFRFAHPIGALRLASQGNGWNLKFADMNYKFVDRRCPELSLDDTVRHIAGRTNHRPLPTHIELIQAASALIEAHAPSAVANGHDCVAILARALCFRLGSCNTYNNDDGRKTLERIIRLAYEKRYFESTNGFRLFRLWEAATGLNVLK